MEWMNKGDRPSQSAGPAPVVSSSRKRVSDSRWLRILTVVLLFSATILAVFLVWSIAMSGDKTEDKFVDNKKLQAVFLNGGQVYFGNIKDLNTKYIRLSNIYYLRVNQTVQPNGQTSSNQDVSLVKLGCELHGPDDEMLISQEQVVFWENLKDTGQVAQAVKKYQTQNPKQDCSTSGSTGTTQGTTTTPQSTTTTGGTSDTTTTKKP